MLSGIGNKEMDANISGVIQTFSKGSYERLTTMKVFS